MAPWLSGMGLNEGGWLQPLLGCAPLEAWPAGGRPRRPMRPPRPSLGRPSSFSLYGASLLGLPSGVWPIKGWLPTKASN